MRFSQLTLWGPFARLPIKKGRFGLLARVLQWMGWLTLGVGLAGCAINANSSAEAKQKVVAERAEARQRLGRLSRTT